MALENIDWIAWHIDYARKEQHKRLTEHLAEKDATIGQFLSSNPAEWQLDSLIRSLTHYVPKVQSELDEAEKPYWHKFRFWKK